MFGASFSIEKKIKKPKNRKKIFFWNFQKIITRKILIVSKNFTFKKMLRISFSIGKKIKKGGYKIEGRGGSVNPIRRLYLLWELLSEE